MKNIIKRLQKMAIGSSIGVMDAKNHSVKKIDSNTFELFTLGKLIKCASLNEAAQHLHTNTL